MIWTPCGEHFAGRLCGVIFLFSPARAWGSQVGGVFKGVPERARAHTFVVRDGLLLGLRLCSVGSFSCSAGRHLECLLLDVIRGFKGVPERGVDEDAAE